MKNLVRINASLYRIAKKSLKKNNVIVDITKYGITDKDNVYEAKLLYNIDNLMKLIESPHYSYLDRINNPPPPPPEPRVVFFPN